MERMEVESKAPVRILLLDDHTLFRESLRRLLQAEEGFQIVASCETVQEALDALSSEAADVVLLDYDLGDARGAALLEEMRKQQMPGRVLMVTAGISEAETLRLLASGACGVFLKHNPPQQLVEAIHQVARGQVWLNSSAMRSLLAGATRSQASADAANSLTARERDVLQGVLQGQSNKEIAGALALSESSVKAALQQLFDKTGVRTRSQLVRIAIEKHGQDWLSP